MSAPFATSGQTSAVGDQTRTLTRVKAPSPGGGGRRENSSAAPLRNRGQESARSIRTPESGRDALLAKDVRRHGPGGVAVPAADAPNPNWCRASVARVVRNKRTDKGVSTGPSRCDAALAAAARRGPTGVLADLIRAFITWGHTSGLSITPPGLGTGERNPMGVDQ